MLEQLLMDLLSKEGLFAVLFVCTIVYVVNDGRKREQRLMDLIHEITRQFEVLSKQYEKLADDVNEIRIDFKDIFKK